MASSTTIIPLTGFQTSLDIDDSGVAQTVSNGSNNASITELRPITRQRQLLVLISSFLTIFITIGFSQSYGVFQSYYISSTQTMLPKSTENDSALVAFVGTLGTGLTWAGSIFVNPIMARLELKGTRGIGVFGVLLMSLAFGLASVCTQVR
jgi:hypothetical protein